MAHDSSYICCGTVPIGELSSHIRSLPPEKLSSHIEQTKAVLQLLMDMLLEHALAHRDAGAKSGACSDSDDSDASGTGDGDDEGDNGFGDPRRNSLVLSRAGRGDRQSRKPFPCQHGCREFNRRQDLVRHHLRRKLPSIMNRTDD
jgi:hypothetical protein